MWTIIDAAPTAMFIENIIITFSYPFPTPKYVFGISFSRGISKDNYFFEIRGITS